MTTTEAAIDPNAVYDEMFNHIRDERWEEAIAPARTLAAWMETNFKPVPGCPPFRGRVWRPVEGDELRELMEKINGQLGVARIRDGHPHPEQRPGEKYVGNRDVSGGVELPEHLADIRSARLGDQAYTLDGEPIKPDRMRPLFIGTGSLDKYDRVMTGRLSRHRRE